MSSTQSRARTRSSSRKHSSSATLSPAIEELRKGWKRGQPVPAVLREHALKLVASGVQPGEVAKLVGVSSESIRLWRKKALALGRTGPVTLDNSGPAARYTKARGAVLRCLFGHSGRREMLRILSEEEARRQDDVALKKMGPGLVFYIHQNMKRIYFIAVERLTREEWSVIELNQENTQLIIKGLPARQSRLLRDQVSCMNLCSP